MSPFNAHQIFVWHFCFLTLAVLLIESSPCLVLYIYELKWYSEDWSTGLIGLATQFYLIKYKMFLYIGEQRKKSV